MSPYLFYLLLTAILGAISLTGLWLWKSKVNLQADDIAGILIILIAGGLLALGLDGEVKSILIMAAGYLFGKRVVLKR